MYIVIILFLQLYGVNMSFLEIREELKPRYNSANSDIVSEFYNKVLSESVRYDRISGFFNSESLAIAASGINKFIQNNGHMRILCGAQLDKEDLNSINNAEELKDIIDKKFWENYESIEDEIIKNHVKILGWMIANDFLEIKIGINNKDNILGNGILHSKIGILYDEFEDSILFDGSVNETAYGWKNNIESLRVFYSWETPEYMIDDKEEFEIFWNNENPSLEVMDVPEATKNKLIKIAPKTIEEINKLRLSTKPLLRDYQNDAVTRWIENNKKGIFAMATGTGKTITALSCFDYVMSHEKKLLTIIVCPQKHLLSQWQSDIEEKFNYKGDILVASSDNKKWKSKFLGLIGDLKSDFKRHLIILTTFNTFSRKNFIDIINYYDDEILLIVDEVHGVGSFEFRNGLLEDKYTFRLGLSATPEIEDDFERTEFVYDFFGGIVYEYDLKKAIDNGFLTPYKYYPEFINLNDNELTSYKELTAQIARIFAKKSLSIRDEKRLDSLLRDRRTIINNAEEKLIFLRSFLRKNKDIENLIIYCCDTTQLIEVENMLNELDISNARFTGRESSKKVNGESERDKILKLFAKGHYHVLTAIKCLDEGVDVPSTQTAVILASTLNSRQHIQRRGRILRKSPNKKFAEIYDLIVFPNFKSEEDSIKNIFKNEEKRYDEYANLAINYAECSQKFVEKWERLK